ncbi:MAG: hypothetical protein AB1696_25300 [Planctomycetota bacterium]
MRNAGWGSPRRKNLGAPICLLLFLCSIAVGEKTDLEINLIAAQNGGRVVRVSSKARPETPRFLNDGNATANSVFSFSDRADHPQAVTLNFAENRAARLSRLVIRQPATDSPWFRERFVARFEVHASRISSMAGFESCGSFECRPDEGFPQSFDLGGRKARFVCLVVTATGMGGGGMIGDLEIWGSLLPPNERIATLADESALIDLARTSCEGITALNLTELEKDLLADARDFRLDKHHLIDAALIVSGAKTPPEFDRYRTTYEKFAERLRSSGRLALGGPRARAWAIFNSMHRDLLKTYMTDSSDVRRIFDCGEYNCVSASLLFASLGGEYGLKITAEDMSGHVLTRLDGEGESFLIETTIPGWFTMSSPQRNIALGDLVYKHGFEARRPVTPLGLVSLVAFNRGVHLMNKDQFREAIAADFIAAMLDPGSPEAVENLLCAYIKFAFHLARQKRYDEALHVISKAQGIDPYRLSLRVARSVIETERETAGQ